MLHVQFGSLRTTLMAVNPESIAVAGREEVETIKSSCVTILCSMDIRWRGGLVGFVGYR